jgi:hypothetical protein
MAEFLFVQPARQVSLASGVLTLRGMNPSTLYFSDRPERVVGRFTTGEFVAEWGKGSDSFKSDSPNATLAILDHEEPEEVVVVLKRPRLAGGDLVYDVEVLDGAKTLDGGAASLFIDTIGRPLTPMSYAGVARRTSRRTARRVTRRRR